MAGALRFNIELFVDKPETFPEVAARAQDLRPAFEVIIRKWAKDNEDKFQRAMGAEASGVAVDPTVFWEPLKPSTILQKRKIGAPNQIMVRTGRLEQALENPDLFFQAMTPEEAIFGTPMSEEEEMKARFNWKTRQTIFLSVDDQRMIEATVKNYFELGEDFEQILFARGLANVSRQNEMASMEMAFDSTVAGQ